MKSVLQKLKDHFILIGVTLIALSALIFSIPLWTNFPRDQYITLFIFNYLISIIYFVFLIANRRDRRDENHRSYIIIHLILLLISAYSLNREMEVFAASPTWFCILLVMLCINYLAFIFFESMGEGLRLLLFFISGIALTVFVYLSIYLMPIYAVSTIGLLFFGISVHAFVPGFFIYHTWMLLKETAGAVRKYWISMSLGITSCIAVIVSFCLLWSANVNHINDSFARSVSIEESPLSNWIQVAQRTPQNFFTEKIFKTDLVYKTTNWDNFFWSVPQRTFGEEQLYHDPLVVLANAFGPQLLLNEEEKIRILKSQFNSRHQAEERLWTGKDLRTAYVATNVQLWPASHIAYTEKTITVLNHGVGWGTMKEEAIYTFHLPEGSVVTSLSLWVNGREQRGILTTKEKAQAAYQEVVGVQRRDPSIVHWQEGNKVTVRIFPVISNSSRTFRVGITSPLQQQSKDLVYENIWFDGPDPDAAKERTILKLDHPMQSMIMNASLMEENDQTFSRSGPYKAEWSFKIKDEGLSANAFSFGGKHYTVRAYKPELVPCNILDIYLDINRAWTKQEFDQIFENVKNKTVWVYTDRLHHLRAENKDRLFEQLHAQNFSLFPVFEIKSPKTSLLITKPVAASPNIEDLDSTAFAQKLKSFPTDSAKINVFNLENRLSPYFATLKEYRYLQYASGTIQELKTMLDHKQFVSDQESEDKVVIHTAGISLVRMNGDSVSTAPDHLMRLFAYNDILRKAGPHMLTKLTEEDDLVKEAQEAYVVSPFSSLIVLETQKDYDDNKITDAEHSLKNASMHSKGAVPEPGEWILIVLVLSVAIILYLKMKA